MSRRIRENLTRWVCRMIGHRIDVMYWTGTRGRQAFTHCDRCGRFW